MKGDKNSSKPTVILNKSNPDGFLDFGYSTDLKHVIEALSEFFDE